MKHITLVAFLLLIVQTGSAVTPQSTAFTYQGSLGANGQPANGNFDLTFKLFDAATSGNQIGSTITMTQFPIANGKFTTDLDFLAGKFTGNQLWIEVTVDTETLTPRQPVNTVPVAQYTLAVPPPPPIFMSSTTSATLTTKADGTPDQVAILPLSGYSSSAYAYSLVSNGTTLNQISLNAASTPPPPGPQLFASNGTIGSMSGMLTLTNNVVVYVGTTIHVSAQVYTDSSADIPGANLHPLTGAICSFDSTNLQTIFFAGLYTKCTQTGLSVPYIAGDQAVLVVYATATGTPVATSLTMNLSLTVGP